MEQRGGRGDEDGPSVERPRIAFINDTSMYESHFGCRLVCQTFREQFAANGLDLRLSLPREFRMEEHARNLDTMDLIVINGEGSVHHDKNRHLIDLAARFPSVIVNCVYQENAPNENLAKFLYISARESLSAGEIRKSGVACDVTPDALFGSSFLRSYPKPEPTVELGCTDSVVRRQKMKWGPFRFTPKKVGFSPKTPTITAYLNQLAQHKRIAIGRFHAAVASSVLGIPFATWESNTWKTRGMMQDMGVPELHFGTMEEAMQNVPAGFPEKIKSFSDGALLRVRTMFGKISQIAHARHGK